VTEPNEVTAAEMETLGIFEGNDAPVPEPEKPAAPPEPEKQPEPAKEPEAAPPSEDAGEESDDSEDLSLDELDARIKKDVREAIEDVRREEQAAEDDERTPAEKALAEENARLKLESEQAKQALADREDAEVKSKIEHSIASTAGKYKMTAEEINAVTEYMLGNPDLVKGKMGFEEAATRRFPQLRDRLQSAPAAPKAPPAGDGAEGVLDAPAASGAGAPKPWKHTPSPGRYDDITQHVLASGEASLLGKFE